MGMIKYSQSTQSNKFALSKEYLRKKARDGVHFLLADKYQSFYKLALMLLMEVARHIQSTKDRKSVIFLQYSKKRMLQLVLCSVVMQNIQIFYRGPIMFVVTCWIWIIFKQSVQPFLFYSTWIPCSTNIDKKKVNYRSVLIKLCFVFWVVTWRISSSITKWCYSLL